MRPPRVSDNPTEGHPPERPPNFKLTEDQIKRRTYKRVLELLQSDEKIPPGQLLAFAAKIGFQWEPTQEKPQIQRMNIFAILNGLPEERQEQILDEFGKELTKARKELNRGKP